MGVARLALAVLAAGAVVTLLVIGGRALFGSFGATPPERERASAVTPGPAAETTARVPTVHIECVADTCPIVTVRVPGGDVLQYREMSRGEEVSYYEPELDVVLSDAGTVRVTENGKPREQGKAGAREAFTAKASGA
ncbi:hypothetical protein ACFPOI_35655 [Nonomuraea angiospora]|uniref:DUF4115 domain-containing protein n=1 Tax=Nonomuraea angiospora TaxID=46172 RepID=A0ABR9MAA7_9ACTN|nr:hypothetical protein [Nonomuraea angiospora]MBE1589256.1 hypothetical protein [Nonomuraea angiospora]MDX3099613.1 hypothetical protein [Nonomuraea angiospora]